MKKSLLIFIFVLLLIGFINAKEGNCNPESGYTKCYFNEKTNNYMSCHSKALAKTQITDPVEVENGRKVGIYVTGPSYIRYKFDGDYFCFFENKKWSEIWKSYKCSKSGCVFNCDKKLNNFGKYYLTKITGDEYQSSPMFATIDFNLAETFECWSWVTAGSGYGWETPNKILVRQVECYDDSDCGYGYYCDKNGDWKSWSCKRAECIDGQDKCFGNQYYVCKNYKWSNQGIITGKCGVECVRDSDCYPTMSVSPLLLNDSLCYNKTTTGKLFRNYYCQDNLCKYEDEIKPSSPCDGICKDGQCQKRSFIENNYKIIAIIIIGVIIVIFIAIARFIIKFIF